MARDENGNPTEFTKGVSYALEIVECTIIGLQNGIGNESDPKYQALENARIAINDQLARDIK